MDKTRKLDLTMMLRAVVAMWCKANDVHPLKAIELLAAEMADIAKDLQTRSV